MASLVLTVIGSDKTGLVDAVAATIATHGGNWEQSRMARLGGHFAGVLRVTIRDESAGVLAAALEGLSGVGLAVTVHADHGAPARPAGSLSLRLHLDGADHLGIIHAVSRALAVYEVNVDELDTDCVRAPMTGAPIFRADARLTAPPAVDLTRLRATLETLAHDLEVEISVDEGEDEG